jgi:hypothetical protein
VENVFVPTIDVHQHLWPEDLVRLLERRLEPPRLAGSTLELPGGVVVEIDLDVHRLESRLALLDRCGIDRAVVSLQPTLGCGVVSDDDWGELVAVYEGGILELARQSERIVPLAAGSVLDGFAGACVPASALLDLDGLGTRLDELVEQGAFLFVHPQSSAPPAGAPSWWPTVVEQTAQMQAAYATWLDRGADRWQRLPVVFAILAGGGPFQLERLQARGVSGRDSLHENVLFETASYGRRALELCLATLGVSQVLFGSDTPQLDPEHALDVIRGFGDAVGDALWNRNPSRLLG